MKTRRFLFCVLCFSAFSGCVKQDPAPLFVDASYQVRCGDCQPAAPDDSPHALLALNGENGFALSCDKLMPGKDREIVFSASISDPKRASNNYGFKINHADIDRTDPGSNCTIEVREGANTYVGACTSGDPSDDKPCHLEIGAKDGIIKGKVLCNRIPNRSDATLFRYVSKPNTDTDPAPFELHGCDI